MCDEHQNENNFQYFMKKVPIYNRNINNKNKNKNNNDKHTLHGACFFASIGVNLARNVKEEGILITPIAPLLKIRKNISGPSEDYDEESIDKDTISLSVMLAPGIFSSHDEVVEFASNLQQLKDMDQNNSFFTDCDTKPYQRSSVNIGLSETSYYFFYEFKKPDLVAGITHKCHRLFLEHIVTKPQVISVEKVAKNKISNHHARWTVESGTKDYRPFSDFTALNGKGETVFVADTGLDEEHCYLKDYDGNTVESTTGWDLTNKIDRNLRKVIQYIELDDIASDRKDSNGHGTHIVASIVGKRLENDVKANGLGDGVANGALISFYDGNDVLSSNEDGDTLSISVNSILSQFFYFPRMAEAKIASASWNSGEFGEYDDRTRQVDEYFHNDPHDLMLMFNSAGNEGAITMSTNYGTTKYPCISKNVLCVGASLNYHSDMSEIDGVAFFSSYGPTKDGRIKPDIVSPGEGILSANAGFNGCGPESYPESVEYGVNHDGLVFKRGTSMACPIAAGAGALVRQYFADGYYPSGEKGNQKMQIKGSLLKAILINGAVELKRRSKPVGGYEDSEYYDRYQGFGKINLLNSLKLADNEDSPDIHVENERIIEKGQTHEFVFENVCNDHEFRVTLVWRDPPSDSGCVECLVNDLDMEVDYDGKTYYPNGRDEADRINNVERVILNKNKLTNPTGNTIRVKVKTANLGYGISQKYSFASTGCFDNNEVELIGSDSGSMCEDDEFEYTIDIFTDRKPEETSWILKKQGSDKVIAAVTAGEYEEDEDRLKSFRYKGCIMNGCYLFIIKDTAFDGLCCEKGMGSYLIRAGDIPPIMGDSFIDRQKIEKFCHYGLLGGDEPTTSPTILSCNDDEFKYQIDIETDLYPDETRWLLLQKPRIDGVVKGSYTESYREYVHEGCLDIGGCHSFSVYGDGEYTLRANDFVVGEREGFYGGKYEELCFTGESINSKPNYGIRTSVVGSNEGKKFDDVHSPWEYGKIVQIKVYTTYYDVAFIGITYENGQSFEHGDKDGTQQHIITLDEDQYVTKVSGRADSKICQLVFETNDGDISGPFGSNDCGYPFEFDFVRNALVYIFGRATGSDITQLGFTHASLPQTITDSPTSQPTLFPCDAGQVGYEIIIRTVNKPKKVWWEIHSIVDSVPFMTYRNQLESYSHTGCAVNNESFEFRMIDKRRDGLCCYFGSGSYKLTVDNIVILQGNHFDDATHVGNYWNNKYEFSYSSSLQLTSNPMEMICSENEFEYRIRVRTNYYPDRTSWTFKYLYGATIENVGRSKYFPQYYEYNHIGCLPLDECFEFYIESRDGLCCKYGTGGYTVFADDVLISEGGEGSGNWKKRKTFCYGPSFSQSPSYSLSPSLLPTSSFNPSSRPTTLCSNENQFRYEIIVTTDNFPIETSWELRYDDGTIIDSVEEGYYRDKNTEHVHKGCLDLDSCVIFTIFDSWGDGLCCLDGSGGYIIIANDIVMAEGGEFGNEETKTFCYGPSKSFSPSFTNQICINGSNNHESCGYWSSIGLCEDNHVKDWMQENCAKACNNCCVDYHTKCDFYHAHRFGACTDTSQHFLYDVTWQEYMQRNCRVSCETCDLDFTPTPTPPVTCSDDQFKYEIVVTNDDDNFEWGLYYKYPEQIHGYDVLEGYNDDYYYGVFPPKYEKRFYGCAKYSCFDLHVKRAYLKIYDYDEDILIAQNMERYELLRFCHYTQQPTSLPTKPSTPSITPPLEAIFTISLTFSTLASEKVEYVSAVVERSIRKILFRAHIDVESVDLDILDYSSCGEFTCDISVQICEGSCDEGEDPDFLVIVGTIMNEELGSGELLTIVKKTGDYMDVDIFDNLINDNPIIIEFDFEYEAWPTSVTTSTTTLPSSTPTQDCDTPVIVQNLFAFITNIFQPIIQEIAGSTDPISDVLFGVESYNSIGITTCKDKMFELHIEIKTDGSPNKTSWELLYENGTIIESIGQDTYSECDTVYNHSYCLDTSCFVLNLFDSFEFKGSYNITVGDTVLAQQDSFLLWKESKRFCYPQCDDEDMFALQLELKTDDWPQETSWDLTFDNGTLVDHVDKRYYTGRNTVYNHRYCLRDGCYDVTFRDHIGDGMCCSYSKGFFKIKINDVNVVIREGSKFEDSDRKSFCHITTETGDEENNSSLFGIITDIFSNESCCTTETTGYPTPVPTTTSLSFQPSILPSDLPFIVPSAICSQCNIRKFEGDSFTHTYEGYHHKIPKMGTVGDTWIHVINNENIPIGTFESFSGDDKAIYMNGSSKYCQNYRRGTFEIEKTNDPKQDGSQTFFSQNCVYKFVRKCYCQSSAQIDFSQGDDCPTCTPYSLHDGAEIKTAPGGFQALRLDRDGAYAIIPGIDIGPSNMPDCTLTIGVYLESIPVDTRGWVLGHDEGDMERTVILHDPQYSVNSEQNVIASGTGEIWSPWANNTLETGTAPTKEWFHVTAVFRQGGNCYVYVNGVKSDYTTTGKNNEGLPDLYVGHLGTFASDNNLWTDAWIKEVKVFNEALSDTQVQWESVKFFGSLDQPPVSDYKVWLDEQSWIGGKWLDKSTYGHHCVSHGTINTAVDVDSGMTYLYGGTTSGVTLTSGWPSGSEYTFFHVTKYNGPTKQRIWNGTTGNWFSGHRLAQRGVFLHGNWNTQNSKSFGDVDSWGVFTDRINSSGSNVRVDGVDVTINSFPKYIPDGIGINPKIAQYTSKKPSDWAAGMVLVYDKYLTDDEVKSVEDWIYTKYCTLPTSKSTYQNP